MPRLSQRDKSIVVESDDLEGLINKAIQTALDLYKVELNKIIGDRLGALESRIIVIESTLEGLKNEVAVRQPLGNGFARAASSQASTGIPSDRAALAAVHTKLAEKQRRSRNIIITGLKPCDRTTDAELFEQWNHF